MSETKKPVGLRLTSKVWESLKQYGLEHKPSGKGQEGFDVTQTIESLLCQALGISLETPTPLSNTVSDDSLTEMIKQQLNDLLSPMLYESASDNQTDVSELLNSRITEIVDAKIGKVTTELETYTQQQCEAVRTELKKFGAIV
jgi:ribosome biogenesis GTPase A